MPVLRWTVISSQEDITRIVRNNSGTFEVDRVIGCYWMLSDLNILS